VFYSIIALAQISLNGKPAIQVILLVTSVLASNPFAATEFGKTVQNLARLAGFTIPKVFPAASWARI
jgi:hypothetical protein